MLYSARSASSCFLRNQLWAPVYQQQWVLCIILVSLLACRTEYCCRVGCLCLRWVWLVVQPLCVAHVS